MSSEFTSNQNPSSGWFNLSQVPDTVELVPMELFAEDRAPSRGLLFRPKGRKSKVGVHLMHPRTDQSNNYNILPLASAGYTVLGRAGRWPNNDCDTVHEPLLLDMAAGIRTLRDAGCEKIVLLGNSGGSSLAAFYQAQASAAPGKRLTHTPAGDAFDLNAYDLPLADGVVIVGPHVGQGGIMRKLIDPSVVDENDPLAVDPALDMYDAENGFVAPPASSRYAADFLERYSAAQGARIRRIDAKAQFLIERQREAAAALKAQGTSASAALLRVAKFDPLMIVYRTTAYPAFVDTAIEADGRSVRSYFGNGPQFENYGLNGFARYITPRAWLSTWSVNHTNARTIDNLSKQEKPLLIVHYSGDCGTRLSEARAMLEAARAAQKRMQIIEGLDHYGFKIMPDGSAGPREWTGTEAIVDWMMTNFPIE